MGILIWLSSIRITCLNLYLHLQAIEEFNGHRFNKRPIAVDWAVPKNLYNGAADATTIASADGMLSFLFLLLGFLLTR